jgi:hypothetical protein
MENQPQATPDWITALPGYQPQERHNHFEIAGVRWQHNSHENGDDIYSVQPPLEPALAVKRILNVHRQDGRFRWMSALWITDEPRIVRAHGEADTLEEAARAALEHQHEVKVLGGAIWYADTLAAQRRYSAMIGEELVTVKEIHDGRWEWHRAVDLTAFRAAGMYAPTSQLEGEAATAMEAMLAALNAPAEMRRACRAYLADHGSFLSALVSPYRPMYRDISAAEATAH